MNKKCFLLICGLVFMCFTVTSQNNISFIYDVTGNRIERKVINLSKSATLNASESEWEQVIDASLENFEIKIYPNPTKGIIKIEIPQIENPLDGSILIYDSNSRLIFNQNKIKSSQLINIQHVQNGFYFLKICYSDEILQWKIIKQ